MRKINLVFLLSICAICAVQGSEKWQSLKNITSTATATATTTLADATVASAVSVLDATVASGADIFLKRKRRYLIFEKGAAVVFQGNVAKSIIATTPRGINWIAEYTLVYDLPYMLEFYRPKTHFVRTTTKAPSTTTTTTMKPYWLGPLQDAWQNPWQNHAWQQQQQLDASAQYKQNWQKKQFSIKPRVGGHRRKMLWCPRENVYKKYDNWSYAKLKRWCGIPTKMSYQPPRRRYRTTAVEEETQTPTDRSEAMFFDLLGKWAEMHKYNARHCIMRTLCESPHLLLPPGHSLLHDLLRILQNYALPHAAGTVYAAAAVAGRADLNECARLYGPHCRVSFLQHFTAAVHGKFM